MAEGQVFTENTTGAFEAKDPNAWQLRGVNVSTSLPNNTDLLGFDTEWTPITTGDGLDVTSNTISVDTTYVAQTIAGAGLSENFGALEVNTSDIIAAGGGLELDGNSKIVIKYSDVSAALAGTGLHDDTGSISVAKMTALGDLTQTISSTYDQGEVEAIQTKLNNLLGRLRTGNFLET